MDTVDATSHDNSDLEIESPALLVVVLDTNPRAWTLLEDLPLSHALTPLLVFINAHLAINSANKVAVIASHSDRAQWLYPSPSPNSHRLENEANRYRPFALLEDALRSNLRELMESTAPETVAATPATKLAGALTRSLAYLSSQSLSAPAASGVTRMQLNAASAVGGNDVSDETTSAAATRELSSRILIVSVSGDLADSYIELMNAIFACQRLAVPIDVLKLAGDPVFLQQASDTTGGIFTLLSTPEARKGMLQYLMFAHLPDITARKYLVSPGEGEGVDFRAACFCHKNVVDLAYVCSRANRRGAEKAGCG
ncbi:transcription factor Tfb4 [Piedraia hortae CBS 480.64]|uniref:General transcription and DNA repair factor IIH subunit TFB4 n=1 Tax=Piedraia hortae CBS 480.64 TaxID=1314780 RepID=A0A6A7C0W2_9PEZI|nr:transcription factor Tfb4 [Piedraia hortae CBS 480.64]